MAKGFSSRTLQVSNELQNQLLQSDGAGQPLPEADRSFMERRFGTDFRRVRVHTDDYAARMSRAINAEAFTAGRDIYFRAGKYRPGTPSGKKLLAHELTHVVQQGGTSTSTRISIQRTASFVSGIIHERNPAEAFVNYQPFAWTPPTLNGVPILDTIAAVMAIEPPEFGRRVLEEGGMEIWIRRLPTNIGSFNMWLPTDAPWTIRAPRARITGRLLIPDCLVNCDENERNRSALGPCLMTPGYTQFTVNGLPSNSRFKTETRDHERQHAADHLQVFNDILVAWDNHMQFMLCAHMPVPAGLNVSEAETFFYNTWLGGTPDQIAEDLYNAWSAAGDALDDPHRYRMEWGNFSTNDDCSTLSIDLWHEP
ncbi:MAG: DUF4157 domain-containing protein [Proteobacteria bacterium]|nr:DUF4157 domain-containing protein [Pseudomonadota bacterium]